MNSFVRMSHLIGYGMLASEHGNNTRKTGLLMDMAANVAAHPRAACER
jgi:hypothetical protein